MPIITQESREMRISQALQVLGMTSKGYTVADACSEVGISPKTYYRWLRQGGDAIEALRTFMVENEREQLSQILSARQHTLDNIIAQLAGENVGLDMLIKADDHLLKLQRELEDRHGAHGIDDSAAKEFVLSGPELKTEKSRLVSVNISIEEHPSVVIDAEDAEYKDVE